jgi:quercetin dioxygenase-like cupin family protein
VNVSDRDHLESASLYAVQALSADEISAYEAHLSTCLECRREVEALRRVVDSFVSWPTDVLRPSESLWDRLSRRISEETGAEPVPLPRQRPSKPDWKEVSEGLFCKLLSIDANRNRVTMLARLSPGAEFPPHRHGDFEELHVLHGELWINGRKLHAGDFIQSEPGSVDHLVRTETGCTCFHMTSLDTTML